MYQAINMVNMVYLGILIFNEHFHVSSGMGEVPNNKKKGVGVGGGWGHWIIAMHRERGFL